MPTCGETLIRLLEAYGVECVFGIPGVHTVELYRALAGSRLRHVTPRHEQGAAFMADGYARVSGRPGVCFLITGPGVTNAATAMGQAWSDSVPMLVISAVNRTADLGMGSGRLHELPDQRAVTAGYTVFSHTLLDPDDLPQVLARAFAAFESERPGPMHVEIPIDRITAPLELAARAPHTLHAHPPGPDAAAVEAAAALLGAARRPALLLGGGAKDAAREAVALAERLAAPALLTLAAKGIVPDGHPLCLGASLPFAPARRVLEEADVVLAVGTEFSETDRNLQRDPLRFEGRLIRVDIEAAQLSRSHLPALAIHADARRALQAIDAALAARGEAPRAGADGARRAAEARRAIPASRWAGFDAQARVLDAMRRALPRDGILVTDSTQPAYAANHYFPMFRPRSYLTSTTGFGTLGYALPAAAGARLAAPQRAVMALIGDGGLQFTVGELATLVENRLAVAVVVWNNHGYGEIRDFMQARDIPLLGVDLHTPDLVALARAYGCIAERARNLEQLESLLHRALAGEAPAVIEIAAGEALP